MTVKEIFLADPQGKTFKDVLEDDRLSFDQAHRRSGRAYSEPGGRTLGIEASGEQRRRHNDENP